MRLSNRVLSLIVAVTIAALAAPAMAQVTGTVQTGGGLNPGTLTATNGGNGATFNWAGKGTNQIIQWSQFNLKSTNSVVYTPDGAFPNVLNIVAAGQVAQIAGTISTNAPATPAGIYFFAPGGVVFEKGAIINPGAGGTFFAAAKAWSGPIDSTWFGTINAAFLNSTTPSLLLKDATLTINDSVYGGANPNLWLIGTEATQFAGDYKVGAYFFTGDPTLAYKNVATLTVTTPGATAALTINSGSDAKNSMWLGKIDAAGTAVNLTGTQIWLPSVTAKTFTALGGTDESKLWNAGVWVYDQYPNYTGDKAIQTTGAVNIQGVWDWVSGAIQAAGNVVIGRDAAALGTPGKTVSVWLLDVNTTGAGRAVRLFADADAGTSNLVPKGTPGAVWVNSISAGGAVQIIAKGEFADWLLYNIPGVTFANGISSAGTTISSTTVNTWVTAAKYIVRLSPSDFEASLLKGFTVDAGGYYY